jgi:hypothetical protein
MADKKPKLTKAQLRRKIKEAEAHQIHNYHFADGYLAKMGNFEASSVIIELTALGGREIIPPTAIRNGLSQATIDAIRADLTRSYLYATEFKPRGAHEDQSTT